MDGELNTSEPSEPLVQNATRQGESGNSFTNGNVRQVVLSSTWTSIPVINATFYGDVGTLATVETIEKSYTHFTYQVRTSAGISTNYFNIDWSANDRD